jgi:enoyl-CoA hydratase/carnithine racemase
MQPFILYEREGGVVTLTMNRPAERNALTTAEQFAEFPEVCERIQRDSAVRAVILTGAGPAFCAGGNVMDMRDKAGLFEGSPQEIRNRYRSGIQRIPLAIYQLEVPTIAAVNGPAVGAGCDLACMCDIRIASERAMFAESFVKLGIIPGDGGAWFLPRTVGMSKAAEMTFTGDPVTAQEARSCGLVSKVVPADQLMDEARALAMRIAANPGIAVRMAKRLLLEGRSVKLDTLLEMSAAMQALAHATGDHREAVNAFLEKRKPVFKGN